MAIELGMRTKILAGVVVLAAAGAGAWFFYLQDLLDAPPPPPKVAAAAPAKPAADAAKAGEAPKAATDAAKPAAAAAPAAPKPAAKPSAKPIPTNPDQLIAEVIETSGIKAQYQAFGREVVLRADSGGTASGESPGAAEARAIAEAFERVFEPGQMTADLTINLKKNLDVERMGRFLEVLRQPIALKMTSQELRNPSPEAIKEFMDNFRKNPPPPARVKLIQALDDATRTSEVAVEMASIIARNMVDAMLGELQKAGKSVSKEARQTVGSQLNAMRNQARAQIRSVLYVTYRNATDEELGEYVKLLDTDTGRWGTEVLATAIRPILASRGSALGSEVGKLALSRRMGAITKAPSEPAPEPLATAQPAPAAAASESASPAAPAEPVGYQRPANIKEVYTRYNDLISASVMRDRAAVKELLDDGKYPNVRQKDGTTPLMIAVSNGDADIAGMLLAKGADPNLRAAGGISALSLARSRGAAGAGLVQLLERNGAKD